MPRLVTSREGRTIEYELTGVTTLGRSSQNTIRLASGKSSRNHARILEQNGAWVIEDLGSSNGTVVNDAKVKSVPLKNGDRIRIGINEFIFQELLDDPLLGTRMGNYQILERIGQGGMGAVYRARQISMDRDVALKVLSATFAGQAGFVESFMREARLAGRLQHPHIVQIHDFGQEGSVHYFSMEYVQGRNLMDEVEHRGPLPAAEVISLASQVAKALSYAHGQNILHQDIKPRNILLTPTGEAKVADLGLAKVMACGERAQTGEAMGTPQYVAPEIIRRQPPDPRADIYSLACTLYFMLTGLPPYQGATAEEIVQMHLHAPIPDPRLVQSDVPDCLAEFVMTGMAKDPGRRPANCDEVLALLEEMPRKLAKRRPPPRPKAVAAAAEPAAAKSAVQQAMSDHTDELPRENPYKPLAIAICALGSVLIAAVIAFGLYHLIRSGKRSAAAERLEVAQQLITEGDFDSARNELLDLKEAYPDSPEVAEAEQLLAKLDLQTRRPAPVTPTPVSVPDVNPVQQPVLPEPTPTPDPADRREERASEAWKEIQPVVDRHLRNLAYGEAIRILETFSRNYEGTTSAQAASARLETVRGQVDEAGRRLLAEAAGQKAKGNLGSAYRGFAEVLQKLPGTTWAEQASAALQEIDQTSKGSVVSLWKKLEAQRVDLAADALQDEAKRLAADLAGLPWASGAADLGQETAALLAYRSRLQGAVRKGKTGQEVSVVGIGICRLRLQDNGQPLAVVDSRQTPVSWQQVGDEDIWDLTPAWLLSQEECIGAALHFAGRGHLGYVRSYLKNIQAAGPAGRLLAQIEAQRQGRLLAEYIDFSDQKNQQRWTPLDGEWRFRDGVFGSMEPEKAAAELSDRYFSLRDLEVAFEATQDAANGQVAVLLAVDENRFLAVRRTGSNLTLELGNGGAPNRAQGKLKDARASLVLNLRGGQAAITANGEAVVNMDVSAASSWNARLCLVLVGTSGSFDNIVVAEGP